MPNNEQQVIGQVTAADSERGVTVHLDSRISVEGLSQGQFVVVNGLSGKFYGTISGFKLGITDAGIAMNPPAATSSLVRDTLLRTAAYADCTVQLSLADARDGSNAPMPARTIPSHFSSVAIAKEDDFTSVFGNKEGGGYFVIGSPRDMPGLPIPIDLKKFVERSNGIFGRSGTGKSMFTRLLLCGIIDADSCVNLIFDMHNEYALSKDTEQPGQSVKGLEELFGNSRVLVCTLDPASSRYQHQFKPTSVFIPFSYLTMDDLLSVRDELDLNDSAASTAYLLEERWGDDKWISQLVSMESGALKDAATDVGANEASLKALWRKLRQLKRFNFLSDSEHDTSIARLLTELQNGRNVVLEFGGYDSNLAYMLVANVITRRIYKGWKDQSEKFERSRNEGDRPRQLMVTIEEAHKFLSGKSGIFSIIAREMRKYNVTLLVIDQRPSSIDPDVISQLGTRITALLSDQQDIDAVFTGVYGSSHFKQILATLDTRQEALIFGHALPMQVVIRARDFNQEFCNSLKNVVWNRRPSSGPVTTRSGSGSSAHLESDDDGPDAWGLAWTGCCSCLQQTTLLACEEGCFMRGGISTPPLIIFTRIAYALAVRLRCTRMKLDAIARMITTPSTPSMMYVLV